MPQVLVPIADVGVGSWSEGAGNGDMSAFNELDEGITFGSGHDGFTSYWESVDLFGATPDPIRMHVGSADDPGVSFGHTIKAVVQKSIAGPTVGARLSLREGSVSIATVQNSAIPFGSWATLSHQLTAAEVSSINNYNSLDLLLEAIPVIVFVEVHVQLTALEMLAPWSASISPAATEVHATLEIPDRHPPTIGDEVRYEVEVAFDSNVWTDVASGGFVKSLQWSRELATIRSGFSDGEATIQLNNIDGRFSPDRRDTVYAGKVRPGKEVRIRTVHEGIRYHSWRGKAISWKVQPKLGRRTTTLKCADLVADLQETKVDLGLKVNYPVDSLFVDVLNDAGVSSFIVDSTTDTVPFAFYSDDQADSVLQELIEHGSWKVFIDGQGVFQARNRYYDLISGVTGSYQGGSPSQQPDFKKFSVAQDGDDIITKATVQAEPRKARTDVGTVGFIVDPVPIFTNSASSFEIELIDTDDPNTKDVPCDSVTLASITIRTQSEGGSVVTSGVSVIFTPLAKNGVFSFQSVDSRVLYFTDVVLQGFALQEQPEILQSAESESGIAEFGIREFKLESDLIGDVSYARDYSTYILRENQGALSQIDLALENIFPDILQHQVGDRLHAVETLSGIGSTYAVYGMKHTVKFSRGKEHIVDYDVRYWLDRNWKIFDETQFGRLDRNRLGF